MTSAYTTPAAATPIVISCLPCVPLTSVAHGRRSPKRNMTLTKTASAYAYRLIWNEICSALIYANRRAGKEISTEPEVLSTYEAEIVPEQLDNTITALLDEAERSAAGVTAKGIRALRLMADGYTAREIGEHMGVSANNVTAWVSRARRYLREIGRYCI